MKANSKAKAFAKKLLHISCDGEGLLQEDKIRAVIGSLPRKYNTLATLKEYYVLVSRKIFKQTMLISSPTEVSLDIVKSLRNYFEQTLGRKFAPKVSVDDSLIAGMRIRAGDRIFEKSIASTLEVLRTMA
jgi:F0F1-type ATP synthase delta subunit